MTEYDLPATTVIVALLLGPDFKSFNADQQIYVSEAAKRLIHYQALIDTMCSLQNPVSETELLILAEKRKRVLQDKVRQLQESLTNPWPEAKRLKIKHKEESPSD